jgi:hypothetical protein
MPSPRDIVRYMRTVGRGSPVDAPWSVAGQVVAQVRKNGTPEDSPLTLADVMASAEYRDLMTAKVAEGEIAPDFELPSVGGDRTVRLADLRAEGPVALVFGSYT